MSWQHQILRVNLTELSCAVEPLNEEWAQSCLGQRGLGIKYLFEDIDPGVDPLAPENKVIFATGPLTGKDDTLPPRTLTEPAPNGVGKGHVCRLDEMLPKYYELRGWNETGVPAPKTPERLGLSDNR